MRFLVENLPYRHAYCPFLEDCIDKNGEDCPRIWDKEFICSDNNPHCCRRLRELEDVIRGKVH